ncbi:phage major capsid protein [Solirubrobacter taibaiensis]|nr:phage major capsid protein [Solirubrobacter taibaiensis]
MPRSSPFSVRSNGITYGYASYDAMVEGLHELDAKYQGRAMPEAAREHWNALNTLIEEQRVRNDRLQQLDRAGNGEARAATESGASFHTPPRTGSPDPRQQMRDTGLRAIERMGSYLSSAAGDRLTDLVERDRSGRDAVYLAAVSSPAYERAFARRLMNPDTAAFEMGAEEHDAVRAALHAEQERALTIASGNFPLPATIDPSILLTSNGELNPIREISNVTSIATSEWHGISSAGMNASFAPEGTEVGDNTPTLVHPVIKAEKAHSYCEFSIEAGMDWLSLRSELEALIADARDQLECEKFLFGDGTDEPEGIISGLAASSFVTGSGTATFAIGDLYRVQEQLPPRFSPRAHWLTSLPIANQTLQFTGPGSTQVEAWSDDRRRLLNKPWHEASMMDRTVTTGSEIALYGDFRAGFKIVDRIGLSVELVPHVLGPNRRPLGVRGLYAFWRVGAGVIADAAIRALRVK